MNIPEIRWHQRFSSRNITSHTYNDETAEEVYKKITAEFYPAFLAFRLKIEDKTEGNQQIKFE